MAEPLIIGPIHTLHSLIHRKALGCGSIWTDICESCCYDHNDQGAGLVIKCLRESMLFQYPVRCPCAGSSSTQSAGSNVHRMFWNNLPGPVSTGPRNKTIQGSVSPIGERERRSHKDSKTGLLVMGSVASSYHVRASPRRSNLFPSHADHLPQIYKI